MSQENQANTTVEMEELSGEETTSNLVHMNSGSSNNDGSKPVGEESPTKSTVSMESLTDRTVEPLSSTESKTDRCEENTAPVEKKREEKKVVKMVRRRFDHDDQGRTHRTPIYRWVPEESETEPDSDSDGEGPSTSQVVKPTAESHSSSGILNSNATEELDGDGRTPKRGRKPEKKCDEEEGNAPKRAKRF